MYGDIEKVGDVERTLCPGHVDVMSEKEVHPTSGRIRTSGNTCIWVQIERFFMSSFKNNVFTCGLLCLLGYRIEQV